MLSQVEHTLRETFDAVGHQFDLPRLLSDANADALRRPSRFTNFVGFDADRISLALDIDAHTFVAGQSENAVSLDAVAIAMESSFPFLTEQHAGLAAGADVVVTHQIVRIVVPDR